MTHDAVVEHLRVALGESLLGLRQTSPTRVYLEVDAAHIAAATHVLYEELDARLQTASGVDAPRKMEILYHWAVDRCGLVVTVRTHVDRDNPEITSITPICPSAEWIEREMWELLGINFTGHPDLRHLVLQDDWPQGDYPLRRDRKPPTTSLDELPDQTSRPVDFAAAEEAARQSQDRSPEEVLPDGDSPEKQTKKTVIPIGPYHPLQEEPEFFKLFVEGEKVVGLDIELGYNHRGIEKLSESKDYEETVFLVERVCGICSTSHPIACVQAIEDAGQIEVPERALYIRSLIGELERIHSHLLWLGLAGHFLGFNTVWMWAWRYREDLLNVCEQITGNRNHYGMMKPGGVRRDVASKDIPDIRKLLDGLDKPLNLFRDTVSEDPLIRARTVGVGALSPQQIRKFGALGPTAQASGVDIDVRRDHPHAAYDLVEWDVVLESNGDIFDKLIVRVREMFESIRIIRQCLERLQEGGGPVNSRPKEVKPGEGVGHYEAPRGEVFHYIRSDGSNRPLRHKIRAPSYMNVPTNQEAVIGETIADASIILAAVDPCYCCTERMAAVVDPVTEQTVIPGKELLKASRDKTKQLAKELGHSGPELPL